MNAAKVLAVSAGVVLSFGASMFAESGLVDENVNRICPVMPENEAVARWSTVYKGKKVHFCCTNCIDAFRKFPEAYEANLPQLSAGGGPSQLGEGGSAPSRFDGWNGPSHTSRSSKLVFVAVVVALLFGIWQLIKRLARQRGRHTIRLRPAFVELFIFIEIALAGQLMLTNRSLEGEVLKSHVLRTIHHSTYYDHGYPPVPPKPSAPKRLSATFFRGNDERSEYLYNGGNYLTAKLHIEIQRENGTPVNHGDDVSGQNLYVCLNIEQAPNTPQRLFAPAMMNRIYLTKSSNPLMGWDSPITDRVALETFDSEQGRWQARYSLGMIADDPSTRIEPQTVTHQQLTSIDGVPAEVASWFIAYRDAGFPIRGADDLRQAGIHGPAQQAIASAFMGAVRKGIVYVCEANYVGERQMGGRFHYGIQYELCVRDGTVQPESDLWMGYLSRSQKAAKGAIPDAQWISPEPLPEVPARQDVSDKLFGIDDYPEL